MTNRLGAGGETICNEFLVFQHQSLEQTFFSGDLVEASFIEGVQPLDIYRSTLLGIPIISDKVTGVSIKTHLVGLVVVLRVILVDFRPLFEIEFPRQ